MNVNWDDPFWSKCCPEALSGCWLWHGTEFARGYGQFWNGSRRVQAHRHAYELVNGPIPSGMFICHRCDVPSCVNPDHLFLGSHADNMQDMTRKGRGRVPHVRGERHGASKLTDAQRAEMRARRAKGASGRDLGRAFGVSASQALRVVDGVKPRGWQSPASHTRLTADRVRDARLRRAAGETLASIAREMGVSYQTLSVAIAGRTWRHVR